MEAPTFRFVDANEFFHDAARFYYFLKTYLSK